MICSTVNSLKGINEKIEKLRRWQTEQQNQLREQQEKQAKRLKDEHEQIQEIMLKGRKSMGNNEILPGRDKEEETKVFRSKGSPESATSWNILSCNSVNTSACSSSRSMTEFSECTSFASLPKTNDLIPADSAIMANLELQRNNKVSPKCFNDKETKFKGNLPIQENECIHAPTKRQFLKKRTSLLKYNLKFPRFDKTSGNKNKSVKCIEQKKKTDKNVKREENNDANLKGSVKKNAEDKNEERMTQSMVKVLFLNKEKDEKNYQHAESAKEHVEERPTNESESQIVLSMPTVTDVEDPIDTDSEKTKEEDDLVEFEILERASEETSFRSTSSIVVKALEFKTLQSRFGNETRHKLSDIPESTESKSESWFSKKNQDEVKNNKDILKQNCKTDGTTGLENCMPRVPIASDSSIKFDDDRSWYTDTDQSFCNSDTGSVTTASLDNLAVMSPEEELAQPSKLMARYFPTLKTDIPKQVISGPVKSKDDGIVDDICTVQHKMEELEKEIKRFRKENEALSLINQQHKREIKRVEKEKYDFEKYKQEEMEKMQRFLEAEKQKLKKERNLYNIYLKTRPQIERQERKEMARMRQEVEDMKSVLKSREMKWNITQNRLQDRINSLETENKCLKSELQTIELKNREQMLQLQQTKLLPTKKDNINQDNVNLVSPAVTGQMESQCTSLWSSFSDESSGSTDTSSSKINIDHIPCKQQAEFSQLFSLDPHTSLIENQELVKTIEHQDGSVEKVFANGSREFTYTNGTRKEVSPNGSTTLVFLFNGDIKHVLFNEKIVYYFAENQTTHTTYPDGLQVFHFANNQLEKHFPDGTKEIFFPDNSHKVIYPDGSEECVLSDRTRIQTAASGDCIMEFANGQKEIHTEKFKKRIFPDGTVKFLYPDGKQETRYANGRLRIKDRDGNLIMNQKIK